MPGRVRPPEEIARLSAAAKAMRRGGATQIEIARALNVPGSTIARWAGEGGWRVCDMAAEMPPLESAPGEEEDEPSLEEMRAELNDRLNRIRASFTVEQMEAFAHENGGIMTETEKENHRAYRREYGYKD
tara:strand:+ start:4250 stop:4639 length:390 start_codon:yes stop_codon:yes gene_type:complete